MAAPSSNFIVYEYGALRAPDEETVQRIDEQLRLAHRYRNKLVEIELQRRKRVREARERHGTPDMEAAQERVQDLSEQLSDAQKEAKRHRQVNQSRDVPQELRDRISELRAQIRQARDGLREARKEAAENPALQAEWAKIDEEAKANIKRARASNGLYWGTYLAVEAAVDAARRGKMDPKFHRWDGSGKLAVQIQNGLPVEDAFGNDTRLQIDPVDPGAWHSPSRAERIRLRRTKIRLRVGSDGRKPIWAEIPISLHRPLPEGGRVKWAYLIRRRVAQRYLYYVQLIIELPGPQRKAVGSGVVAIDMGWRMIGGELRVAYWLGDDRRSGELRLPADWVERMEHRLGWIEERDRNKNAALGALVEWLEHAAVPDWLADQIQTVHKWKSPRRLARLVEEWQHKRFGGDEVIFDRLWAWFLREQWLYKRIGHSIDEYLRRRREIYRLFAADLRKRYGVVAWEDMDLRRMARRSVTSSECDDLPRRYRGWAALSELRAVLNHSGMKVVVVPSEGTTRICAECGAGPAEDWDARSELIYRCANGHRMDQDLNAARNILAQALTSSSA